MHQEKIASNSPLMDIAKRISGHSYLFLATGSSCCAGTRVTWLHLEDGPEEVFGESGEEFNLGIRVEAIQVRALGGQTLINVGMVTFVVGVGWQGEAWR